MEPLRAENLLARKSSDSFGTVRLLAARLGAWVLLLVVVGLLAWLLLAGGQALFFRHNPHYLLRQPPRIEIVTGSIAEAAVLARLDVTPGTTNLYELNLAQVRRRLLEDPIVRQAEVRLVLPDTLWIRVFGRTPVAQLARPGGQLVDSEGMVLPPATTNKDRALPILMGIPHPNSFKEGDRLTEPLAQSALEFLQDIDTAPNGHWLDPKRIQLISAYDEVHIFLHARPDRFIREDAELVVPAKNIPLAISHALQIIDERSRDGMSTSYMNVTLKRVPVRP